MESYGEDGDDYTSIIPHEMGHCIYFKLKELGENPVSGNEDGSSSISPNFRKESENPNLSNEEICEQIKKI